MTLRKRRGSIGSTTERIPDIDNVKRDLHEWSSELNSLKDRDYKIRTVIHKGYPILKDLRQIQEITVSEQKKRVIKELIKKVNREMDNARLRA